MLIIVENIFFFNDTATTEIYTLSLHDALPICPVGLEPPGDGAVGGRVDRPGVPRVLVELGHERDGNAIFPQVRRSEEHTSELQSRQYLVCRLLLEKKKNTI